MMVAKITYLVDSILDVWQQIDSFLLRESQERHEIHRKYVMSIMLQRDFDDSRITSELEEVLDTIISSPQVVVVVQAGEDQTRTNADIDKWPGADEWGTNLIIAGAMDVYTGKIFPFSKAGQHLTVLAPGEVECAIRGEVAIGNGDLDTIATGSELAAALVTSLIAYFLSLRDLDVTLQGGQATVPFNMKWFLVAHAKRLFGLPDIWNQLPAS